MLNIGDHKDLGGISSSNLDLFQADNADDEALLLEGNLTSTGPIPGPDASDKDNTAPFNTLDEPIRDTIWRDVRAVGLKFKHALYPVEKKSLLKNGTCGVHLFYALLWQRFYKVILMMMVTLMEKRGLGGMGVPNSLKFLLSFGLVLLWLR